jgi:hypothetical protein
MSHSDLYFNLESEDYAVGSLKQARNGTNMFHLATIPVYMFRFTNNHLLLACDSAKALLIQSPKN